MKEKIYNIPFTQNFADVLAIKFLNEYQSNPLELADVLFLLPSQRACNTLKEAFVKAKGLVPTLLPQMISVSNLDEDDLSLGSFLGGVDVVKLPPEVKKNERLLLFVKIIMAKPDEFGIEKMSLNQACFLAQELARLIDVVNNEKLDFSKLEGLVPEEYSTHWQETLKFLGIITSYWPAILSERGLIEASQKKNQILELQSKIWQETKPNKRIVAAGVLASFPAIKELLKTVSMLENGEVYLSGCDKFLSDDDWEEIEESHPQYEIKKLLEFLGLNRFNIIDVVEPQNLMREKFISEVMRPASTTDKWLNIKNKQISKQALYGLNLVECKDIRQEAIAIALIMRESVETPEKTAFLVTTDRNLARRVGQELERWNIKIDDSAGKPFHLSHLGIFLRSVIKVVESDFDKTALLCLLKNPLTIAEFEVADFRKKVREVEKTLWREQKSNPELEEFLTSFKLKLAQLYNLYKEDKVSLKSLIRSWVEVAEDLAGGAQNLWKGDAGEAGASFVADLYEKADILDAINPSEFLSLIEALMSQVMVRTKFGTHPRLRILGPIESRLAKADVMIVGEVNEGSFPLSTSASPWLSNPMKKDFGIPLSSQANGILAHDFSGLLAASEVFLVRAERVQGTPMVKSRWWMRLETVLKAMEIPIDELNDIVYKSVAIKLDEPNDFIKISSPMPKPPVSARPRKLSATQIETLMRDPYSIFARRILNLKPLDELDKELSMADYGSFVHEVLNEFNDRYRSSIPANAEQELLDIGLRHFAEKDFALNKKAFWWPSFEKTVKWVVLIENEYRKSVKKVYSEIYGDIKWQAPAGEFVLTATADRVDELLSGGLNILDYKTGKIRSKKEVAKGYAPQLPIEAIIAQNGGFGVLSEKQVKAMIYWQLGKKEENICENVQEIIDENFEIIKKLIALFDFEDTAYICQPNPKHLKEYSDYEHLARVKEWCVMEGDADD